MSSSGTESGIQKLKSLLKSITVSRLTLPDDANVYGNVHGGTTLKLIEEAGIILSTRYCNYATKKGEGKIMTTMSRIESVDFLKPMKIGEVVELTAEIIYTCREAILIEVTVHSEDIFAARKHVTNRARLWYVAMNEKEESIDVPQMPFDSPKLKEEAQEQFGSPTFDIANGSHYPRNCFIKDSSDTMLHTVANSETCLSLMVGPNDVAFGEICRGGVFLKLMDECAGIVAAKHCRTNVVTACIDATNFYTHIRKGSVLTVHGKATFTSNKSIEVEVDVLVDSPFENDNKVIKAVDSFFTYVSIGKDGRALEVPALQVTNGEEKERFDAGMQRYLNRKRKRQTGNTPQSP